MAFLFALLLCIGIIWVMLFIMNRGNPGFDERQIDVQRRAYQMGYTIESGYLLGLYIYSVVMGDPPLSWTILILIGTLLAAIPVVTCIIWKDAYLLRGQKYLTNGFAFLAIGLMDLYTAGSLMKDAPAGGEEKVYPIYLISLFMFWISGVMLVKHFVNKRLDKAE